MNETFSKIDVIIIIILALLVAFIIGFNIIQIIDTKLNSVVINVPPQNLPQILVNFDKDNKPIKLNNDQLNLLNNNPNLHNDTITNISMGTKNSELDKTIDSVENFGSLPDKYDTREDKDLDRLSQKISSNLGNDIINDTNGVNIQNPNYNTINNPPLLIDPENPNEGYYKSRVKLITDSSSPLLKLEEKNMQQLNQVVNACIKNQKPLEINGTYDGYNRYPNLQGGSFANFTSIGKSLLTPYTSYPVPS
jgi:hypothetical protein